MASNLLTKQQAAELLDVDPKSVERYVKRGTLKVAEWVKPSSGGKQSPMFTPAEVERFKAGNQPAIGATDPTEETNKGTEETALIPSFKGTEETAFQKFLESLTHRVTMGVPIADKPLLSLAEASALTGISERRLAAACRPGGSLKAIEPNEVARGWRIKRTELDAWLKKL